MIAAKLILALNSLLGTNQAAPPFEDEIKKFEAADIASPPKPGGIVFVGSSSIVRWTTLKQDFPEYNVINRGFGGSEIADSVRYADRIVTPYMPKLVIFFAGTNDIANGKTAEKVFSDYQAFVAKVHYKLPKTPIAFISISPAPSRWAKLDVMKKANGLIKDWSHKGKNLIFIDCFDQMLTKEGGPRPEFFVTDQLHLSPAGYAIWVKAVRPVLAQYLAPVTRSPRGLPLCPSYSPAK